MKAKMKRLALFVLVAVGIHLAMPTVAHAAEPTPNIVDDASGTIWVMSAWWVTLITAAVIPLVTGILTRWSTRSGVKTAITIVLNLASAIFTTAILEDGTAALSGQMIQTFVLQTIISLSTYEWGWKKAGLTSSAVALPDPNVEGKVTMVPGKLAFFGVK